MILGPVDVALEVVAELERLAVPYAIGGSFASSAHGLARATQDIDIVADLAPAQADALVRALDSRFYVDPLAVQRAVERRSSFNLIHNDSLFKIDVFVPGPDPLDREQILRRQPQTVAASPERRAYVITAEDVILQKLRWYRRGGEVSERQWRDVLGVLKVHAGRLDLAYLQAMATEGSLTDLLDRARQDALRPMT